LLCPTYSAPPVFCSESDAETCNHCRESCRSMHSTFVAVDESAVYACRWDTPPAGAVSQGGRHPAPCRGRACLLQLLLDALAFFFMLLPVFVLAILVAIPNALAIPTLLEGITLLVACRTQKLGRGGPMFLGVLVTFGFIILSFPRFAERHGAELLSSRRCTILVRCCHGCLVLRVSKPSRKFLVVQQRQIRSHLDIFLVVQQRQIRSHLDSHLSIVAVSAKS
jgi:hypothetical protein